MSQMIEVKTAELIGPALDVMVAEIEGVVLSAVTKGWVTGSGKPAGKYSPSTDWSQCGPLIEKYRPDLMASDEREFMACLNNDDRCLEPLIVANGPTYLIAACRAIAAAKLGAVVSVPAELMPR